MWGSRKFVVALVAAAWVSQVSTTFADGPDVILGQLVGARVYAVENGVLGLTVGTTSCNAGDKILSWHQLPDNQHPIISLNMFRVTGDRMEHIGQSFVKHGFLALQQNICGFGCTPNPTGNNGLGIGCSDPYSALNNQGPGLGSRSKINPFTGFYDGNTAGPSPDNPSSTVARGLQVKESDLLVPNSRYFIEGQYITPDDATSGNGNNNVSHMEVWIERDGDGNISIRNPEPGTVSTIRETPAVLAWPYAQFSLHDEWPNDGRFYVGYRVVRLSLTKYRYTYVVYNMNSDKGANSFSIPVGNRATTNLGFSAVASHDESWSNAPWVTVTADGNLSWSTANFDQDPSANALRWGTSFTFWFEADAPPTNGEAKIGYFKTSPGSSNFSVPALVPAATN